jgi:hypothetical protein
VYGRYFGNTNNAGEGLGPYGSFVLGADLPLTTAFAQYKKNFNLPASELGVRENTPQDTGASLLISTVDDLMLPGATLELPATVGDAAGGEYHDQQFVFSNVGSETLTISQATLTTPYGSPPPRSSPRSRNISRTRREYHGYRALDPMRTTPTRPASTTRHAEGFLEQRRQFHLQRENDGPPIRRHRQRRWNLRLEQSRVSVTGRAGRGSRRPSSAS